MENIEKLFAFLTELNTQPFQLNAFLEDPAQAQVKVGISGEELAALARHRGDAAQDWRISNGPWARSACCADPGPDQDPNPDPM